MAVVNPTFDKLLEGCLGSEGPVFNSDGKLYMVAPGVEKDGRPAGQVLEVDIASKEAKRLCEPQVDGYGGIPAGCQADREGNFYVADMRLGILLVKPNGEYTQIAKVDEGGRTMQGCNDCSLDFDGNLWVTAPAGDIAPHEYKRSFEEGFGSIYCLTTDKKVIHLDTGFRFPNGIAVKHDSNDNPVTLIVAETPTHLLWAYDIEGPGQVKNKRKWGKLTDFEGEGGPDGMDFDENGNLLAAYWGAGFIEVFGPEGGDPIKRIKCPFDKPSNIHFEPNTKTVYVTEHTYHGLWRFEWENKGMPQYCDKK